MDISNPTTPNPSPRPNNFMGLLGIFLVAMGCLILVCVVGSGYLLLRFVIQAGNNNPADTPTPQVAEVDSTATPFAVSTPSSPADLTAAMATLKTLSQTVVPVNDPLELAAQLRGKTGIAPTLPGPSTPYQIGDKQSFWIVNDDNDQQKQVTAKLAYATDHLYFWVQDGINVNSSALKKLSDTFENKIYPTDREFFGSEWTPGIDNDPHLYVLYARGMGSRVAGYFSSVDEIPPAASEHSNGHEMFCLNADNLTNLSDSYVYSVLAHEFQHMIHWYRDRNEEGWMNEGFSVLAELLNGYDIGGFDTLFARNPDMQLNDWPDDKNSTAPHYGAGFLFLDYFLNRFGEDATKALVADPKNGLDSIDVVLSNLKETDPTTRQTITADDLFTDWTLANYLRDSSVGDGRYAYKNYSQAPSFKDTTNIRKCPATDQNYTVSQYGTDYIRISCRGNYTLSFQGSQEVGVLPEGTHSGSYAFWSNKGDESDMTLAQTFDFSAVKGSLSMSYWTWYDLEEHYDFVYLEASTDGGKTWQIIKTPSSTDDNISGNNFGWGYNAKTNNWIQEKVDLSKYAGQKVALRFQYITDTAVNGEGFLLDDVEIPEIHYQTDFEKDNGGWDASGFVRMENHLPQTYRVSIIQDGKTRTVQYLKLNDNETLSVPLDLTNDAILVVSGTTRYTRLPANYTISIK